MTHNVINDWSQRLKSCVKDRHFVSDFDFDLIKYIL